MTERARPDAVADRFAGFLTVLSAHLGEPDLGPPELAGQLHLSRSLLDRIVSAAAGEPTGRLRRRLLLERAAFQLRSTGGTVLEIAVEAGYSSHEAFTRAFQRAYGSPPAAWRTAESSVHLPAPSGIHFHPPGGLRLPPDAKGRTMNFTAELTDQHAVTIGKLIDSAQALTPDELDTPIRLSVEGIDDEPTIRSLLSRLVGQLAMWTAAFASRPYDFAVEDHESLDSMRERLASAGPAFTRLVREASSGGRLEETFVDATCEPPMVFTIAGMIAHVLTFAAYRKTLVAGALSTAGAADVEIDPLSWFAP